MLGSNDFIPDLDAQDCQDTPSLFSDRAYACSTTPVDKDPGHGGLDQGSPDADGGLLREEQSVATSSIGGRATGAVVQAKQEHQRQSVTVVCLLWIWGGLDTYNHPPTRETEGRRLKRHALVPHLQTSRQGDITKLEVDGIRERPGIRRLEP